MGNSHTHFHSTVHSDALTWPRWLIDASLNQSGLIWNWRVVPEQERGGPVDGGWWCPGPVVWRTGKRLAARRGPVSG